jgi:hypothetical protein
MAIGPKLQFLANNNQPTVAESVISLIKMSTSLTASVLPIAADKRPESGGNSSTASRPGSAAQPTKRRPTVSGGRSKTPAAPPTSMPQQDVDESKQTATNVSSVESNQLERNADSQQLTAQQTAAADQASNLTVDAVEGI